MRDLGEKFGTWVSKILLETATLCVRIISRIGEMEKGGNEIIFIELWRCPLRYFLLISKNKLSYFFVDHTFFE